MTCTRHTALLSGGEALLQRHGAELGQFSIYIHGARLAHGRGRLLLLRAKALALDALDLCERDPHATAVTPRYGGDLALRDGGREPVAADLEPARGARIDKGSRSIATSSTASGEYTKRYLARYVTSFPACFSAVPPHLLCGRSLSYPYKWWKSLGFRLNRPELALEGADRAEIPPPKRPNPSL